VVINAWLDAILAERTCYGCLADAADAAETADAGIRRLGIVANTSGLRSCLAHTSGTSHRQLRGDSYSRQAGQAGKDCERRCRQARAL